MTGILVTGATGRVGREVVRLLVESGQQPRVLARRPDRVVECVGGVDRAGSGGRLGSADIGGIEIVPGDYGDRDALGRALRGVCAVFVVTNSPTEPDDMRLTEAAKTAGVRHLVKLSMMAVADPGSDDLLTRGQRANEEVIRRSGLDWTFLRARTFMSNTLSWAPSIRSEGVVRALYGTAPIACVDPRDIAEVAVRVLTGPGHEGRAYPLSGPEPISAVQQTQVLARVLRRPLKFEELGTERARAHLLKRYPPVVADAFLESAERQLTGVKARVECAVPEVTGRQARTFGAWAEDHAGEFDAVAA